MDSIMPMFATLALFAYIIQITSALTFNASECNIKKSCVNVPDHCIKNNDDISQCEYIFSYAKSSKDSNFIEMEFVSRFDRNSENYMAVGFSNDKNMGNESVISCGLQDGKAIPLISRNDGKSNLPYPDSLVSHIDINEMNYVNDLFYCKMQQNFAKSFDALYRPDPSKQFFILFAKGPLENGALGYHTDRTVSSQMVRLEDVPVVARTNAIREDEPVSKPSSKFVLAGSTRKFFVILHGLFMIIAWLGCITLGIFSARYLRESFDSNLFGLKVWFQIHRTLNGSAVVLIVAALISIAVAKDFTWSGPSFASDMKENLSVGSIHSLAGAIAILCSISQPFNALLRCSPNHPRRSIFNVFHRTIGICGFTLALIALFIAINFFKSHWSNGVLALGVFCISIIIGILLIIASEIMLYRAKNLKSTHVTALEMTAVSSPYGKTQARGNDVYNYQQKNTNSGVNKILFGVFAAVFILCTIILVILIA